MSLRTTRALVLLLCAVVGVTAGSAGGRPAQLTPVEIAMLPLEPTAQAMYAKHRGMFRKQGLDAKLTILADPAQIVAALLSGDVQFIATHVGAAAALKSKALP